MTHTPKVYTTADQRPLYWFECSCGFMGDTTPTMFGAANRWRFHMDDVAMLAVREAVADFEADNRRVAL